MARSLPATVGVALRAEAAAPPRATLRIRPTAKRLAIRLLLPSETKGSGTPVSGAIPITAKRLIIAVASTIEVSPATRILP